MDAKMVAGYISSGSDFSKLPDVVAAAGLDSKDVNIVRYIVSAAPDDLKTAITSESTTASIRAVTRISEELSISRGKVADLVDEIRAEMGLDKTSAPLEVKNIGNNTYLGLGGLLFKPSKEKTSSFEMVRYTGEGGDVELPAKIRFTELIYTVESIEENAFRNSKVSSVYIPEGYLRIEEGAFDGCELLQKASIPSTVERIGNGAFKKCARLSGFEVSEDNRSYSTDKNGILYTADRKYLLQAPGAIEGEVALPDGLEVVCDAAFYGCAKVAKVSIPSGVKRIGKSAFSGCSSLAEIRIPASVTEISDYALNGCVSLRSIEVDEGSARFASKDGALFSKDMKTLVRAPGGIEGEAKVPDSVETVGNGAFQGCERLVSVRMGASVKTVSDDAFKGCKSLTSASIGESVEKIGKYAFMGCGKLESISIPDSVKSVGTWAFGDCPALKTASVPSSLEMPPTAFPQETKVARRRWPEHDRG
ncbi:MAG: leucine-rich repeat domain-containing protein [Candidatus Methanomethylophilaceae archaeon]|nr:leucine-rich repeat domain-containing protein [Candidatus Methanomethylophilaceae archaeon]